MNVMKHDILLVWIVLILGTLSLSLDLIRFVSNIIHQEYNLIYSRLVFFFVCIYYLYLIYKLKNTFLGTQTVGVVCITTLIVIAFSFYFVLKLNNYFYATMLIAVANAIIRGFSKEETFGHNS
jgi:hypothetical protein